MTETAKPDCFKCKYMTDLPGDAQKCCKHPMVARPMDALIALLGGSEAWNRGLGVVGDPRGIKNGWFKWPLNYDPTWLKACNGFTSRYGPSPIGSLYPLSGLYPDS